MLAPAKIVTLMVKLIIVNCLKNLCKNVVHLAMLQFWKLILMIKMSTAALAFKIHEVEDHVL